MITGTGTPTLALAFIVWVLTTGWAYYQIGRLKFGDPLFYIVGTIITGAAVGYTYGFLTGFGISSFTDNWFIILWPFLVMSFTSLAQIAENR